MWEHPSAFNKAGAVGQGARHRVIANPVLEHVLSAMFCSPLSQEGMSHALRFPWYLYQQEEQNRY